MKAHEFDKAFDDGEDISDMVDWSKGRRLGTKVARLEIELSSETLKALEDAGQKAGVSREALVKSWIEEHIR